MKREEDGVLRVVRIIEGTSVDGPGLRTSVYFAGCNHRCPGCHNPETWDADSGSPMTVGEILRVVDANGFNVTFTGGDPLCQPEALLELARQIKRRRKTIWCYTGYTFEEVASSPALAPILQTVDVLVDGPFVEELRDTGLVFRGSSNQRIIDCSNSREGKIELLDFDLRL